MFNKVISQEQNDIGIRNKLNGCQICFVYKQGLWKTTGEIQNLTKKSILVKDVLDNKAAVNMFSKFHIIKTEVCYCLVYFNSNHETMQESFFKGRLNNDILEKQL